MQSLEALIEAESAKRSQSSRQLKKKSALVIQKKVSANLSMLRIFPR
jgi:hypothetical protein